MCSQTVIIASCWRERDVRELRASVAEIAASRPTGIYQCLIRWFFRVTLTVWMQLKYTTLVWNIGNYSWDRADRRNIHGCCVQNNLTLCIMQQRNRTEYEPLGWKLTHPYMSMRRDMCWKVYCGMLVHYFLPFDVRKEQQCKHWCFAFLMLELILWIGKYILLGG